MMMIDPVDSDDDEAQDIGKKGRPHPRQGSRGRIVRGLQLQNHDGNENGDNAIAERFDPVRLHAPECNTGGPGRKPAALDPECGRGEPATSEIGESIDSNCYGTLSRSNDLKISCEIRLNKSRTGVDVVSDQNSGLAFRIGRAA